MVRRVNISKKHKHKLFKWLAVVFSVFVVLILAAWLVVKSNEEKIEAAIKNGLETEINGEVSTGDIRITMLDHFPHLSVSVENVKIRDKYVDEHQHNLLEAGQISLQVRVLKLLQKKIEFRAITLHDAEIYLFRMEDSTMNTNGLIKPKADSSEEKSIDALLLSRVYLQNVHFYFEDKITCKVYDLTFKNSFQKINHGAEISKIDTKDQIKVKGITFKPERGSCLTDKTLNTRFHITWNRTDHSFTIDPSSIEVDRIKLVAEGTIGSGPNPAVLVTVKTKSIKLEKALSLVSEYTRNKLAGYQFDKAFPMTMKLSGNYYPDMPLNIDLYFNVSNNTFATPAKTFTEVSFTGHYFNHLHPGVLNDESNSAVTFTNFKGKYEGMPFSMDMYVTNIADPFLKMHLKTNMPLTDVNQSLDTAEIVFTSGTIDMDIDFRGKLKGYVEKEKDSMDAVIFGKAGIHNAALKMPGKKYFLKNIDADLVFDQKSMRTENLKLDINNNPVQINLRISQFIYALVLPNAKLKAEAEISCNHFNLDHFYKPVETASASTTRKKIGGIVSNVLSNLEGNLQLHADKISYKKLNLINVNGTVIMGGRSISCQNLSMTAANGSFLLNGKISGIGSKQANAAFTADLKNTDISALFYQLDNFNQKSITSENIRGKLDAVISFSTSLNSSFSIMPETMSGNFDLTIKDGELRNMDALNQISKNIFKKKDFSDIQFATLNHTSSLAGTAFHIDQMEIQSNVLTLYVQGVYSFADSTELFIRVPVKSMKAQEDDYIAENREVDEKIGMSINLKATKADGKLKITPMLFHKKSKE